jgi:hypothetical protein
MFTGSSLVKCTQFFISLEHQNVLDRPWTYMLRWWIFIGRLSVDSQNSNFLSDHYSTIEFCSIYIYILKFERFILIHKSYLDNWGLYYIKTIYIVSVGNVRLLTHTLISRIEQAGRWNQQQQITQIWEVSTTREPKYGRSS